MEISLGSLKLHLLNILSWLTDFTVVTYSCPVYDLNTTDCSAVVTWTHGHQPPVSTTFVLTTNVLPALQKKVCGCDQCYGLTDTLNTRDHVPGSAVESWSRWLVPSLSYYVFTPPTQIHVSNQTMRPYTYTAKY